MAKNEPESTAPGQAQRQDSVFIRIVNWPRKAIRRLYAWMMKWGDSPWAERALFGFSFSESSFFPIPPDPLLIAMTVSNTKKWLRFALITATASVLGAALGYLIGFFVFETIGQPIIDAYHLQSDFEAVQQSYTDTAFVAVFAAGFTPIPFKVFTLAGGFIGINFPAFILASFLSRGARFALVAWLAHKLGAKYKDKIEKYIDLLSLIFVALLVLGFVAIRYLL
jgi:membrane protein YqaA with SNARE-associated domain